MRLTFFVPLICLINSCEKKNEHFIHEDVVKIVKVRSYEAKYEFDELVTGRTTYGVIRDEKDDGIGWVDWANFYYDKYDNLLCKEEVNLDGDSVEVITRRRILSYYSPKEQKLSIVNDIKGLNSSYSNQTEIEQKYHRDAEGLLTRIERFENGKLLSKQHFKYNANRQRTRIELFEQGGVVETTDLFYESPNHENYWKAVTTVHEKGRIIEETVEREGGYITMQRFKVTDYGKVVSDMTTRYSDFYSFEIAKHEVREGLSMPMFSHVEHGDGTTTPIENKPQRTTIKREVNRYGDVTRETSEVVDIDEQGRRIVQKDIWSNLVFSRDEREYKYTYNSRGDWIKQVRYYNSIGGLAPSFIVVRDITYLK